MNLQVQKLLRKVLPWSGSLDRLPEVPEYDFGIDGGVRTYAFLVTGCGRSGTHFVNKFLQLNGIDVGHEAPGEKGVVGWDYGVRQVWRDRNMDFEHKVHLIRDPRKSIRSMQTIKDRGWALILKYAPECRPPEPNRNDLILASGRYWLYWNRSAMALCDLSVKLEEFEDNLDKLSGIFGKKLDPALIAKAREHSDSRKSSNSYGDTDSLAYIARKDPELYNGIKELADEFGYALTD